MPASIPTIPTVQFRGRTLKGIINADFRVLPKGYAIIQNGGDFGMNNWTSNCKLTQSVVHVQKLASSQQHHKEQQAFAQTLKRDTD